MSKKINVLLCLLLLIAGFFPALAQQNKRLTVQIQNGTLLDCIKSIESQTDYTFLFSNSIGVDKKVGVNCVNQSLDQVLAAVFTPNGISYEIQGNQITLKKAQAALKRTVSGKVTDNLGAPVIGAGVVLADDPTKGTITDENGNWALEAYPGNTLRISSIGMKTIDVPVTSESVINITMENDVDMLEDAVVIGYGTARKADLTGSTGSLNGDRLKNTNAAEISTQLQGQMAGVQVTRSTGDPASGSSIRIRGITTMSTNDPLIIVDGIPGSLSDVAAEDVQDIQVLKDAASAAIYGSRASAGVILVTTKRAKEKDFHLSYTLEYGIDTPTTRPEVVSAVEWMDGANEMKYNDGAKDRYSFYAKEFLDSYNANHQKDPDSYPDTNWDSYLRKSFSHQRHSFNLSGGTEKLRTNFSLNYFTSDDIVERANYDKYNLRSSNDYQINSWIHASADLSLLYSKNITPGGSVISYINKAPIYACYWSDGELADAKDGDNPYANTLLNGQVTGENFKITTKIQLDLTPVKGLTLTAVAAPNYTFYKGKHHNKRYSMRRLDGSYVDGQSKTALSEYRNDSRWLTMQFYANYKLLLGNHSFSAMAGYEDNAYEYENNSSTRSNYTLDNYPYLNLGPADYQYNNGNAGHDAYRSVFGRLMYSYANRYLLQANFRADGSSRFAKENRWGYFPSFSAGWVISEEPFFNNKGLINFLKLRASWGKLGNERIGSEFPYQALLTFGTNATIPNNSTGVNDIAQTAAQQTYAVRDITWETTTTYGAGIDLSMLDSRLRLTYDWYYKKTEDMLLTIGFPSYFGYNAPQNNAADMNTKGWDLELSWSDHVGNLSYGVSANLSDYRSRMGYMADKQSFSGNTITEEGSFYQEWYLYQSKGLIVNDEAMYENGNKIPVLTASDKAGCIRYEDIDGDGKITASNDRVRSGNSLPELLFGGSIWANWKNLDFNLSFQGIGHQNSYWSWGSEPYLYTAYACPKILLDSHWSPDNDDATNAKAKFPMITTNTSNIYAPSTFYLFNGAYTRIKNITLGYTLPKNLTNKITVNRLRLYVSVNDLPAFFHHYPKGYDPEWNRSGDYINSSYIVGINLTF